MNYQLVLCQDNKATAMMDARRLRARGADFREFIAAARFWNWQIVRIRRGLPQMPAA